MVEASVTARTNPGGLPSYARSASALGFGGRGVAAGREPGGWEADAPREGRRIALEGEREGFRDSAGTPSVGTGDVGAPDVHNSGGNTGPGASSSFSAPASGGGLSASSSSGIRVLGRHRGRNRRTRSSGTSVDYWGSDEGEEERAVCKDVATVLTLEGWEQRSVYLHIWEPETQGDSRLVQGEG